MGGLLGLNFVFLRERKDYKFNFDALKETVSSPIIEAINFYTEDKDIDEDLKQISKLKKMVW